MSMKAIIVATSILASGAAAAQGKQAQPGSYQVDPAHSKLGFAVPHLVISSVDGRFTKFAGTVDLAPDFAKSKVKVEAEATSVDTGVGQRDDHLRSPDFFDAGKFPKLVFASTSISGTPEAFKLNGNLTIKGVTKPVTFDAKYLGTVVDAYGNQKVAYKAQTKIKRQDFGLTWSKAVEAGPVVGDEVTIDLSLQAGKPAPKK